MEFAKMMLRKWIILLVILSLQASTFYLLTSADINCFGVNSLAELKSVEQILILNCR